MRFVLACGIAALMAGCAPMPATSSTSGGASADMVATPLEAVGLTIKSWGHTRQQWRIAADGTGTHSYAEQQTGRSLFDEPMMTKRIAGTPDDFARIAALVAPAERYADGETLACRREITDQPYGDLTFERGGETIALRYDRGCRGSDTAAVYQAIDAAQAAVAALTADQPIVSRTPRSQ